MHEGTLARFFPARILEKTNLSSRQLLYARCSAYRFWNRFRRMTRRNHLKSVMNCGEINGQSENQLDRQIPPRSASVKEGSFLH